METDQESIDPEIIEEDKILDDKGNKEEVEDAHTPDEVIKVERLLKIIDERISLKMDSLFEIESGRLSDLEQMQLNKDKQIIEQRERYGTKAFRLVMGGFIVLGVFLLCNATKYKGFYLSDKVILSLIAGVTINLMAVLTIIMKNLFPHTTKK